MVTALLVLVSVGLATAQAELKPESTAPVRKDESSLRQIPYTINVDEVQGAYEILANVGLVKVSDSATVPVVDGIVFYFLQTAQDESVAYDVFIPRIKEDIAFDSSNSVRATALLDTRLLRWPNSHLTELYGRIDDDPNFETVVQKVRKAKGLRLTDEKLLAQIAELTQNAAVKYLKESGFEELE